MVPKKNWTASRAHACVPGRESGLRLPAAAAGVDQIQLEPKNLQDAPKTSTTEDTEGHRGTQRKPVAKVPCALRLFCGERPFSLEFMWGHFRERPAMRLLRSLVLAIVLAGAFFYFTTYRSGGWRPASWGGRPQHIEITEAASE